MQSLHSVETKKHLMIGDQTDYNRNFDTIEGFTITGNKYKFGLYFKSSCTTAEYPLCAALNSGVAPSYKEKTNYQQI